MENIIEKLYRGELCPAEECEAVLESYKETYDKKKKEENSFYSNLTEEQKEQYEKLMQAHFLLSGKELEESFYQGFQTAVRLILHALV